MTKKIIPTFLILFFCLIISCNRNIKPDPPENLINEEKIISVIIDVHIADGLIFRANVPSKSRKLFSESIHKSVFSKYGITRAIFDSSISYYMKNTEAFEKMYEKVLIELSKIEGNIDNDSLQ